MKITNNNNIPLPIYRAITQTKYSGENEKCFASVTGLLKGTKQFILERRYANIIEEEASDRIWSLMGSAIHTVMERSSTQENLSEERLNATINDKVISGGVDLWEDGYVYDFKFTSVRSFNNEARINEWTKQLNLYAFLYKKAGFEVKGLKILAIFRDWQKSRYKNRKVSDSYPNQVEEINLQLWSMEETEDFISRKLKDIEDALDLPDQLIPNCSCDERWEEPAKYALIKPGASRALKVFDDKAEAETHRDGLKDKDNVLLEIRQGGSRKCEEYCPVSKFCNFPSSKLAEAS